MEDASAGEQDHRLGEIGFDALAFLEEEARHQARRCVTLLAALFVVAQGLFCIDGATDALAEETGEVVASCAQ